jgi:hypothetical protein
MGYVALQVRSPAMPKNVVRLKVFVEGRIWLVECRDLAVAVEHELVSSGCLSTWAFFFREKLDQIFWIQFPEWNELGLSPPLYLAVTEVHLRLDLVFFLSMNL